MSVDIYVALQLNRLPPAATWADRIQSEGFDVEIDRDFDPKFFSGYLPCPNASAGFEYSVGEISSELRALNLSPVQAQLLSGMDSLVSLSSRSEADLNAAQAASAALALITDGFVIDGESGAVMTARGALAWARDDYIPADASPSATVSTTPPRWTAIRIVKVLLMVAILASLARQFLAN